ncbi:MAG: hypothetical protein ACP5QR_16825 [Rhizomicrobium sp.]
MRDYGRVYTTFWSSADIRALSDDAKLLALYLLTSPHTTIIGAFRLPDGYVTEDLGWSAQRVRKGFDELFRKGYANRCETVKWAWIRKFLEWNAPENPNQWKAARKLAAQIPADCSWKPEFYRAFAIASGEEPPQIPEPFSNGCQTLSKPETGTGTGTGTGTERRARKRASRVPAEFQPDLDYARSQLPDIDAEREAQKFRDWEFKTPRSDWAATWRNWIGTCRESGKYARLQAGSNPDGTVPMFAGKPMEWR